jgi:GntR family transcriptional repressor for pyruvate dehydrogenase complex
VPPTTPPKQADRVSAAANTEPLEALSLTDSAAARIAAQINSGELRPGQKLAAERTLAAELNVSRPALREALQALQSAGLVRSEQKSGWYVTAHSTDAGSRALVRWLQLQPLGDIIAVRRILEPEAISVMPAIYVPDVVRTCDDILLRMRRAVRAGKLETAADLHSQFHGELIQYASSRLARTLQSSMIDAVRIAQRDIFGVPRANTHTLAQHDWILDALRDGDVRETARRVKDHLTPTFNFPSHGTDESAHDEH